MLFHSFLYLVCVSVELVVAGKYAGVNIAGFDFGTSTDGSYSAGSATPPLPAGPTQMQHFVNDDKQNAFRLPVAWQYLVDSPGQPLNQQNFAQYDQLVQACLKLGAHCIIDIHNYARWNGQIIGQGGPTNDQFADTWSQLAKNYASDAGVIFGVMNEPHDLDMTTWAGSVQAAVTAIRNAGATDQMILLPGSDFTTAGSFISDGSAQALASVTNPGGGTDNLVYDIHVYFDADNSGTQNTCASNKISDALQNPATWMQQNNRQVFVSELGGGEDPSCLTDICAALDFLNQNSDVFIGWTAWAAGSFPASYTLSLLDGSGNDTPLMKQCFAAKFDGGSGLGASSGNSSSASSSTGTLPVSNSTTSTGGTPVVGQNPPASPSASASASAGAGAGAGGIVPIGSSQPYTPGQGLGVSTGTAAGAATQQNCLGATMKVRKRRNRKRRVNLGKWWA